MDYAARREQAARALAARRAEAYAACPELETLARELAAAYGVQAREQARRRDAGYAHPGVAALRQRQRALLAAHGFAENHLEPQPFCANCADYGEVGGQPCACGAQDTRQKRLEACGLWPVRGCTFETYNADIFPEEQQEPMRLLRETLARYAQSFPQTKRRNVVLSGGTGLGKTFALACTANAVFARGFSVRYVDGASFKPLALDALYSPAARRELFDAELLVLDDLGSEPDLKGLLPQQVYALIHERAQARRHTLVGTNLSHTELTARYGERAVSRLFDRTQSALYQLAGKDVRRLAR